MRDRGKNNLFWRLMRTKKSSAKGHEDFVTEALASVLYADQELAKHFLKSVLRTNTDWPDFIEVKTQTSYPSDLVGASLIDLELRSESMVVFVENKISAPLNKYMIESEDSSNPKEIDQIEKYDIVLAGLDTSHPSERHLLAIGQEPLKQPSDNLQYFRRDFLWWDIYRIIDEYYSPLNSKIFPDDYRRVLANEFLAFLQIARLDPPRKLSQSSFSASDAVRLLADAIREVGEYTKVTKGKNESGFTIVMPGRCFIVWFDGQPAIRASEVKVGGLRPPELDDTFWNASVAEQGRFLAAFIESLPRLERDESAPVSVEEALTQFVNCQEEAENILTLILDRWEQLPSTGKKTSAVKEISLVTGSIRVRLAPYSSAEWVILNTGIGKVDMARALLRDSFEYDEPAGALRKGQVNMPLEELAKPGGGEKLMSVIESLAAP